MQEHTLVKLLLFSTAFALSLSDLLDRPYDVDPFLALLKSEDQLRPQPTQGSTKVNKPGVSRRGANASQKVKDKCSCKDRAARRLRREIKDVTFATCRSFGKKINKFNR